MGRKTTATVTWLTYRNFGTYLQAYALQKALEGLGYDNKVIDDGRVVSSFPKKVFSPLRMIRNISFLYPERAEFRKKSLPVISEYEQFKSTCIKTDNDWNLREDLSTRYDAYIAGSDQIWSPITRFDDFYYLGFTDRKKIAYAPSLGTVAYPDNMVRKVKPYLASFSAISVREAQGADILRDRFAVDAKVVADPTMLLTRDDWDSVVDGCDDGEPYVLCYFLSYNRTYIDFAREFCRQKGLKFRLLVISHEFVGVPDAEGIYAGPQGFLKAVKGAEYILTDSFHGTIFSLIYEKRFCSFKRFKDGDDASQNSRLENLLGKVGLMDRLLDEQSLQMPSDELDYASVRNVVSDMRAESLQYLKEALCGSADIDRKAYAVYAVNQQERAYSASGGAASMLARSFVLGGGIVYGCSQECGVDIRHIRVDKDDDLWRLAGSKYVLSRIDDVLPKIKDDLEAGNDVLFIGLPCQVAGVRKYCSGNDDKLYTIDLCCHGTPSQKLLKEHLQYLGLSSEADRVKFRTKSASGIRYSFRVYDSKGACLYDKDARKDFYMTGFVSGLFLRECCFSCPYAKPERGSDLTLADHWAMGKSSDPEMILSKGISTVLLNTEKGRRLFADASQYLRSEQRPMHEALRNARFISPSQKPADYDDFLGCLRGSGYAAACRKYLPPYMRKMAVHELKSCYYKSPLRKIFRKLLGK